MVDDPRIFLRALLDAALAAVAPAARLPAHLPDPPPGRTVVLGAGKAAAAMARSVEESWAGPLSGLVIVPFGHAVDCRSIEVVEAAHPVPDRNGLQASEKILALARGLGKDDLALCLFSGGGSSLLVRPSPGLTLDGKRRITEHLLLSGAGITEINCVRKHLSSVKGGRLAAASAPARIATLLISDVAGDSPAVIASGPTVPDPTTRHDARRIVEGLRGEVSRRVFEVLDRPESETPKPGDPALPDPGVRVVAAARDALAAAGGHVLAAGFVPEVLGESLEGEAREVGRAHAGRAVEIAGKMKPGDPPRVLLSGGELTVDVRGKGRGGPNTEYLLALAIALDGRPGIYAVACDTDGIDGSGDNAGAMVTPETLFRSSEARVDPEELLAGNDSYRFFAALGDLLITGPTRTNVNDFRAILVTPDAAGA